MKSTTINTVSAELKLFAVIRLRGTVKAKQGAIDTLMLLRLNRKMHCVVLLDNASYKGMLQKAKDYITWGTISDEVLKKLVTKRGRKDGNVRLNEKEAKVIVDSLKANGKIPDGIKPVFRLNPPSKGFRGGIKHGYPIGELGNRGEKINELLERMI